MNKIERELVRNLRPAFSELGFSFNAKREFFIRPTEYGFDAFLWTAVPTASDVPRLELGIVAGLRHEGVDDIVNRLGIVYGEDNRRFTNTISAPFALFPPDARRTYSIPIRENQQEEDIPAATVAMREVLATDASPLYKKFSSLSACAEGLNVPVESRSHPLLNNFERRMYYGLTCAKLGGCMDLDELEARYRSFGASSMGAAWSKAEARLNQLMQMLRS